MKVLITGASGMLGQDLLKVFSAAGYECVGTDRKELDITDAKQVQSKLDELAPDTIINAAAYNFVDKIEDPAIYTIAYAINATGPENLARVAGHRQIPLVHYSTNGVFAGDRPAGYAEDDLPNPISKYGETKLAGEKLIAAVGGQFYICRTSKLFGRPGIGDGAKESFVALMLRLAKEKPELKIVDEEVGCPTYTPDIALATLAMLESRVTPGVYHLINEGEGVTWYQFAQEIFALMGVTTPCVPITSAEFAAPAKRPAFGALLNTKLPKLRSRTEALREFLEVR